MNGKIKITFGEKNKIEIKNVNGEEICFAIGMLLEAIAKKDYDKQKRIAEAIINTNKTMKE